MRRYPVRKGGRRWHIAPERWREILAARDAERMARPAPVYIEDPPAGALIGRVTVEVFGRFAEVIPLHQPPNGPGGRRPRCDSREARHDGRATTGGWTVIFDWIARTILPRAMSRRAIATMER